MAGIQVTGNSQIDHAVAEIAIALRDASPGDRDQEYYDAATALRDRIMEGTRALDTAGAGEHQIQLRTFTDGRAEVSITGNGPLAPGRYRGTVVPAEDREAS